MILPSVFEPGGAVVLEAMASGKAVIAVKWGGPADVLDANCGILIEPRDPASLVADLERCICEVCERPKSLREHGPRGAGESSKRLHLANEDQALC